MKETDIRNLINSHMKELVELINEKLEVVQQDIHYWTMDDKNLGIILTLSEVLHTSKGSYVWHQLRLYGKYDKEYMIRSLKNILKKLELKPFHDEDAPGGGLYYIERSEESNVAVCYISPEFKDGYWENHTLPSKIEGV